MIDTDSPSAESSAAKDVDSARQLGLVAAVLSLGGVFWIVGGMEMIERLAYYGVRAVAALYATAPASLGGLGISASVLGDVFMLWALVQSVLPVFVGGLADRFGYRRTIFLSTVIKILAYLCMAWFPTYPGFLLGAVLLATGTAIFKPGIQGTLVHATRRENSAMAWGIFYQLVNVGGWLGPLLAGYLRSRLHWYSVFYACAGIIALNFLWLLTYRDPLSSTPARTGAVQNSLWRDALRELRQRHVWTYLVVFSGFWFMFNTLFDVLPLHIRDWVDTRQLVRFLFGDQGIRRSWLRILVGADPTGTFIQPEGMLNLNAGLIMTTCFFFAWLGGRVRATTSMIIGTLLASLSLFLCGQSTLGVTSALAIGVFSIGEMLSSPKFSEFLGNVAPRDKTAMYLGFSQIPLAVGWTLEGKLGPLLYDHLASKERFARALLLQRGTAESVVDAIPEGDAFQHLVRLTGKSAAQLTAELAGQHCIGAIWWIMALVGLGSALGILWYSRRVLGRSDFSAMT